MKENFELKLQAWLDGELSAAEAQQVSRQVANDAGVARLAAELRAIKDAMAGNEMLLTVPETRDFYWSKIARQIESEDRGQRTAPRTAGWRHWLSPLVGFAGLACMLVLATRPNMSQPTFDEISSTSEDMETVTFHDQSADMTVVWLAGANAEQTPAATPAPSAAPIQDNLNNSEVEME